MLGVLTGLFTVGAVIGVGILLAQLRILDAGAQQILARITFNVATPALILSLLSKADIGQIWSARLAVALCAVGVVCILWILPAVLVWKRRGEDLVIGSFVASYINANNLGIPMATFVLGSPAQALPMLLLQLCLLQPLGLAVLDVLGARERGQRLSVPMMLSRPVRNPMTVAAIIGVLMSVTGAQLPTLLARPIDMLGAMSVPAMLLAFGVSLRLGPLPGRGEPVLQIGWLVVLKLAVMPLVAWWFATFVFGLDRADVLAATVMAGLPTAQNVFVIAHRYGRGLLIARDGVFVATIGSAFSILVMAALLHA